jgi:hypothetical protein
VSTNANGKLPGVNPQDSHISYLKRGSPGNAHPGGRSDHVLERGGFYT